MSRPTSGVTTGWLPRRTLSILAAAPLAVALAACTTNNDSGGDDGDTIDVTSTADACELSTTTASAGALTFHVTNKGSEVTEFYLLRADGENIVGEVENIGPGLSRDLVVSADPGEYVTACKPGMTGDGIRGDFTVEESDDEAAAAPSTDDHG